MFRGRSSKELIVEFGENGIPFIEPVEEARLEYSLSTDGSLQLEGNKDGLLLLARALVGMAHCEREEGFHIHLDDLYDLNESNASITISKGADE